VPDAEQDVDVHASSGGWRKSVSRFVMVHGAFTGGWIWSRLAERLRSAGHTVDTFDLPGAGDDLTPPGDVTLDLCARRLVDVLNSREEPALIAANSFGGIVATQGAALAPHRVAGLIYIAAFMPANGQSLLDLAHLPEGADDQVQANLVVQPPVGTLPTEVAASVLYQQCDDDVAAWAVRQQRSQPLAPFGTPVTIPPGALDAIPRYYVVCEQDRAIPVALQRRMIQEQPCDMVIALTADHTPHLSRVADTADALEQFALHAAGRGVGQ
jgi:pimeloyl-ACP methyl ester carboxylesterase